jgi:hypothetical protein
VSIWVPMLALGAWHGVNPAMGWLFAVALGMQRGKGGAVWGALPPLALGHAVAVSAAVSVAALAGLVCDPAVLKWIVAGALLAFGVYRLLRSRHPRFGGMVVGFRDLAIWSALMASAHGAGLMVVPFVVRAEAAEGAAHLRHAMLGVGPAPAAYATAVHTLGYLLVTGVVALVVHRYLGLRLLRTHWINLDLVWAAVLIVTAVVTPLM